MTDSVNHPSHYKAGGIEVIDIIESQFSTPDHPLAKYSFHLGNVAKYLFRAGWKRDAVEDLEKANWYLSRCIQKLKEEGKA